MRFPRICFLRGLHTTPVAMLLIKAMKQEKSENAGEIRKKEGRIEDKWKRERNRINNGRGKGGGKGLEVTGDS